MIKYLIIGINKNSKKKILFKAVERPVYKMFMLLVPKAVRRLSITIPFLTLK